MFIHPPTIIQSSFSQNTSQDFLLESFDSTSSISSTSFDSSNSSFSKPFEQDSSCHSVGAIKKLDLKDQTSIYRLKNSFSFEPLFSDSDFLPAQEKSLELSPSSLDDLVLDLKKTEEKEDLSSHPLEASLEQFSSNPKEENNHLKDLEDPSSLEQKDLNDQNLSIDQDDTDSNGDFKDNLDIDSMVNIDANIPWPTTSLIAQAPFDHEGIIEVKSRNITIQFLREMDSYWLHLEQEGQKEVIPLQGTKKSLLLKQDEAFLTLLNAQNEKIISWIVRCLPEENSSFLQEPSCLTPSKEPDVKPTTNTLIVPLEVESHEVPFITPVMQPALLEKEEPIVLNEPIKPFVLEDLEEDSLTTNLSYPKPTSLKERLTLTNQKVKDQIDSLPSSTFSSSLEATPTPGITSTPSPSDFVSSSSSLPSSFSQKVSSTPTSATALSYVNKPSEPIINSSSLKSLASLEPTSLDQSSSTLVSVTSPAFYSKESLEDLSSREIASPSPNNDPTPLAHSSLSTQISKPNTISEKAQSEKSSLLANSNTSLRTYLAKNLEAKATGPIATIQQAGKVINEGNKIYVKNPGDIKVNVENGSLQNIVVRSKETKKNYIDLESAMKAEKQAIFELEAQVQGSNASSSQAKWTLIPIGEPLKQSLSFPTQEIESFYSLDETGKLSSYRQSPQASIVLCRGFEPLENQSVTPGEKLRVYVDQDLASYSLLVNGKSQEIKISQDELGQSYVPISVKAGRTEIALKQNGKTVYSNSLQANNPLFSWGWIAPLIGSVVGLALNERRKRAI